MPLENAQYINQLNTSLPLGTDPVASVDDHIRLIKEVLKNTFPNLTGPVSLSASDLNGSGVPSKGILMYSGAVNTIPTGWFLCDGQNNTPDLRDRFIVGAGGQYALGAKGGSNTATTSTNGNHNHTISGGSHSHTGTVGGTALTVAQLPAHSHTTAWGESNTSAAYGVDGTAGHQGSGQTDFDNYHYKTSETGGGQPHTHDLSLAAGGDHVHTVTNGGDHSHTVDTRSPYYALCFIMKG